MAKDEGCKPLADLYRKGVKQAMDEMLARMGHGDLEYVEIDDSRRDLPMVVGRQREYGMYVDWTWSSEGCTHDEAGCPNCGGNHAGSLVPSIPVGKAPKPAASEGPPLCDRKPVDKPPEPREFERVRELQHNGPKTDCPNVNEPVYAPDGTWPEPCRRWVVGNGSDKPGDWCGNEDWRSKGFVRRDKKTGVVVDKEYERKKL